MSVNYDALSEITVKSQSELDMIPDDFKGRIYIEFGTYFNRAVLNRRFYRRVVAWGNSSVVARGNSSVEAWGNSSVEAWGNSSVVAWENSSVVAWGNSSVVAWGNSSVEATGNVQVVNRLATGRGRIEVTGNARVVFMPRNIEEFMSFYGIKHDKKKAIFFKAVHHTEKGYISDHDPDFMYPIGEVVKNECDPRVYDDCSYGIHIAHRSWCLDFGRNWSDLAIIEVETDIDKIVLPNGSTGKVRTSEVKVLREIPLEECGVFGKILSKRTKEDK